MIDTGGYQKRRNKDTSNEFMENNLTGQNKGRLKKQDRLLQRKSRKRKGAF